MSRLVALYRDAFRGLSREVWLLSLFLFVNRCGTMVLTFLVLYLTQEQGFSEKRAGLALTCYGIGGLAGIWVSGQLVDRIGFKKIQVGCQAMGGLGYLILPSIPTAPHEPWLFVAIATIGFVGEGFRPANGAAVSAYSTDENRARSFGLNRQFLNLGMGIGPLIGGLLAKNVSYDWLFYLDGSTCIAAALLMALFLPGGKVEGTTAQVEGPQGSSPWVDKVFVWGLLFMLLQGLIFFQLMSTYPLQVKVDMGLDEFFLGSLFALNAAIILVVEMPLVNALERRSPLRIMAWAGLLTGLGFGLAPLFDEAWWIVALVFVWTAGEMLMAPMGMAWVASRSNERNRGRYMAGFAMCFSLCSAAAPFLGTLVYEEWGAAMVWWGCLGMGVVVFSGYLWLANWSEQ